MGILGHLAIKVPRGREPNSKNVRTTKFQVLRPANLNSAPQQTTIKTCIMAFFTKHQKKAPKKGCFNPKSPQWTQTWVLPGSAILILCTYQLSSNFWKVSEKCNGQIKSYEAKSVIIGAFFPFFEPLGTQPEFFQKFKNNISLVTFVQNFREF